jgi:hypothetical protein
VTRVPGGIEGHELRALVIHTECTMPAEYLYPAPGHGRQRIPESTVSSTETREALMSTSVVVVEP